jgi:polar amino acid transport system substrate-binding protein
MRTVRGLTGLVLVAAIAAACSTGGGASPSAAASAAASSAAASPAASVDASAVAPSAEPSASADACAPDTLALKTPGTLTISADNPSYPPFFEPSDNNPDPWELGDPTNGKGFESAVAFALAQELGFAADKVTWIPTPFNNAIQPGPKDFDIYLTQVSYSPERAQAADLSDGYYNVAQSVVALKDNKIAKAKSVADLKGYKFGAQVGTTSLQTIEDVIAPSAEPKVYDSNDAAIEALKNGQIDGLVVDLPSAFYVTAVQVDNGIIVGQFAPGAEAEHYSVLLDLGSPLTACINAAIGRLTDSGKLAAITQKWLADKADAPVFTP